AIPGQAVRTISPLSLLPPITGSVLIDGSSQPGYAGAPLIALDVLTIAGEQVTVRGLIVGRIDVDASSDERLVVRVHANERGTRRSLLDPLGHPIVQGDGISLGNPDPSIDQHIPTGIYSLVVDSHGGMGDYALTATATPAVAPFQPLIAQPVAAENGLTYRGLRFAAFDVNCADIAGYLASNSVDLLVAVWTL